MSQSPVTNQNKISEADAKKALWKKGRLIWKLDDNQKQMYHFVRNTDHRIIVIGSSRQSGKSYFLVTLAIEECLRNPNIIVKYVAPQVGMIRKVIAPLMREITEDCPKSLRPSFKMQDNKYIFPNGSEIHLAGTDNGNVESIRGTKAHLCIVDEAAFCDDLKYVVNGVLFPTTSTTDGKIVMASTPPTSIGHDFVKFIRDAELEGRFIRKTIYDNPRMKPAQIAAIAENYGGVTSTDFRREYMSEVITSEDDAVVPEFTKELKAEIVKEVEKPPFYDSYVAMDIGTTDLTVILFAYYNFRAGKIIIEDEIVMKGKDVLSDTLAPLIKSKEAQLWGNPITLETKEPYIRVADNNNPILLNELSSIKHNVYFIPTLKDNAIAQLGNMRVLLKNKQILIHPRCKTLIHHLETAIWNKARTSFGRSADAGHFDAIDALKYLCRNINFNKNPYPVNYNMNFDNTMIVEKKKEPTNPFEKAMVSSFKVRNVRYLRR